MTKREIKITKHEGNTHFSVHVIDKYKSYTNSNCVPSFCRDLQTITE